MDVVTGLKKLLFIGGHQPYGGSDGVNSSGNGSRYGGRKGWLTTNTGGCLIINLVTLGTDPSVHVSPATCCNPTTHLLVLYGAMYSGLR